jgi:glycosyltransferase involved in cell wall biosynthesis
VNDKPATLSIVIPIYQGADTVATVVDEIFTVFDEGEVSTLHLEEVVLVNDGSIDDSAAQIIKLAAGDPRVRPVWLSRNYGQHAATLAGCASTVGDWIVTMDEDGLHDPRSIDSMHRTAAERGVDLVYAHPRVHTHSRWRIVTSMLAKRIAGTFFGLKGADDFSSFRLMDGFGTRALAAYCGYGVYLDVALQWVFDRAARLTTDYRAEQRPSASGYSLRALLNHFRRMMLTAGPRPLRLASLFGLVTAVLGFLGALGLIVGRLAGLIEVPGWTSVMVAMLAFFGIVLIVLGVVAEYLTMVLAEVSGRPPYLITGRAPRRPTRP